MAMNDAALDIYCQQFGENYDRFFACLFPQAFCKYRWQDFLLAGCIPEALEPSEVDFLIAADWFTEEANEDEIGELLRLAVEWRFKPPSEHLHQIAEDIRQERAAVSLSRLAKQITEEIERVFAAYR